MRTTLDLDDRLVKEAKKKAVEEGTTLTSLLEEALRERLHPAPKPKRKLRLALLTRSCHPLPGVDFDSRDALVERMEGRA